MIVKLLLAAEAKTCAVDAEGRTPLHYAAQTNAKLFAELLLIAGAQVDPIDAHGKTPLYYALSQGHTKTAKLLGSF